MKLTVCKWLLCLMALLMPLGGYAIDGFNGPTWYDYRDTSLEIEDKGTFENPIVINTPAQLAQLAYLVNEENNKFTGKFVVLGADINLNKVVDGQRVNWVPIGYYNGTSFDGLFLGANTSKLLDDGEIGNDCRHSISGIYIDVAITSNSSYLGLFGHVAGYLGHFSVKNAAISFSALANKHVDAGLVCGLMLSLTQKVSLGNGSMTIPNYLDDIYAEGKIASLSTDKHDAYIGGLVGDVMGVGIVHCSVKCDITSSFGKYIGGVCGITNDFIDLLNLQMVSSNIQDCTADVNIVVSTSSADVGGIAGCMNLDTKIHGCSSYGQIEGAGNTGGICGRMTVSNDVSYCPSIIACTSGAWLKGGGNTGGIVGEMEVYSNGNAGKVSHCAFAGHIEQGSATYAAGICGSLAGNAKDEHITKCLMTGTLNSSADNSKASAIVSYCANAKETVSNCYYDTNLYKGNVANGEPTHLTIKGLTTEELTSADLRKVSLFDINEEEAVGFSLRKGYYPRVYFNVEWPGYDKYEVTTMPESQVACSLFNKDDIDKTNTVYLAGTWLSAVPLLIPKGDDIYDLVSQVSVNKADTWSEISRSVAIQVEAAYPEDADFLEIEGNTAKAIGSGTCLMTVSGKFTKKPVAVFGRPEVLLPRRFNSITATQGQTWDGSTASEYAAGTGIAEDPFIIKNSAQLAKAVQENQDGQWFKQLCDITINKDLLDNNQGTPNGSPKVWIGKVQWKGRYNGDGHCISGAYMLGTPLFGNVDASGEITNLALLDSYFSVRNNGALAYNMNGKIVNCIVQGTAFCTDIHKDDYYNSYAGGICGLVGPDNPDAVVEDCIAAVINIAFLADFTPLVNLNDKNRGKVRNCLVVVPVALAGPRFETEGYSMAGHSYIENCYWLKGYEPNESGNTLEEINNTLGKRQRWTVTPGYFPTLKTFENTDYAKMLSVPVRTDIDYNEYDNYLLGFRRQLQFEPAMIEWTSTDTNPWYLEIDSEMGIMAPIDASYSAAAEHQMYNSRRIVGLIFMKGQLGRFKYRIPMRTGELAVNPGITFEDDNAREACLAAFDTNHDGNLMLSELKAVTNQQTLSAFQTETAKKIKTFPEFRFFKSVTKLTTQLNNLSQLENVRLPYALKTIGSDAFKGCTSLKEVTVSQKVSNVEPHAFFGSAVENIMVDPFNENYKSRDGVLFDANNALVAYPNGRSGEEITISGVVSTIFEGAIYHINGLKRLYLDFDDYNRIIPELEEGGIETTDGSLIDVYVKDASDGGLVLDSLMNDYSWEEYNFAKRLHRYYPVDVNASGFGSFYIGFDTELPEELTPYTVPYAFPEKKVAYLREESRQVPKNSPVVIYSKQPGVYRLMPYESGTLTPWKMYENRLNGVGANGIAVYAEDSYEGGIYTLQHSDLYGTTIFNFYQEQMLPPYHAYLPYNSIGDDLDMGVVFVLAPEVINDDMRFFAMPDMEHRVDSVAPAYNEAVLTAYEGGDGNMVAPRIIHGEVFGKPVELTVSALASNIFANSIGKLDNIDLALNDDLQFFDLKEQKAYTTVPVNREAKDTPFYGVSPNTLIYLSDRGSFDVQGDNVIVGDQCQSLVISDGQEFRPRFYFHAANATYQHEYQAKTYPIIMPFAITKPANARFYRMLSVNEDTNQFVFTNVEDETLEAGAPYLMVVDEGTVELSGTNTEVQKTNLGSYSVGPWMKDPTQSTGRLGYWTGTYTTINNAAAIQSDSYVMQSNGTFRHVDKYQTDVTISPFMAYVEPWNTLDSRVYEIAFQEYDPATGTYAETITPFPADTYAGNTDMPEINDNVAVIWSEEKQTLYFTGNENEYEVGDTYNGATITALWMESEMLNTGSDTPQWSQTAHNAKRVVFDADFERYHPASLHAWFKDMSSLTTFEGIKYLNTDQALDMSSMFEGCSKLVTLDVGDFKVDYRANCNRMFANCSNLTTIYTEENWVTGESYELFEGCTKLVGAVSYDPDNTHYVMADYIHGYFTARPNVIWCEDIQTLFFDTPHCRLEKGTTWNGHTVTNAWKADEVINVGWNKPGWVDTKIAGTLPDDVCHVIITEEFATQQPKSLYCWFNGFNNLQDIEGLEFLNTSQVDNMNSTFMSCSSLKSLNVTSFDVSKVSNATGMFRGCKQLVTIFCDNTWRIRTAQTMFNGCTSLVGAVPYDRMKTNGDMANPETGYFTHLPVVTLTDLGDNSDVLAAYAGKKVNVRYDRRLNAIDNGDGTYTSRAFTACLPFDIDVYKQIGNNADVTLYYLVSVTDNFEFIFHEARYRESVLAPNVIYAGDPYVIVVNKGTFRLEADNVTLKTDLKDFEVTDSEANVIGYWKGTFSNISNDDAAAIYAHTMSNDGYFRRISNEEERYRSAYVGTFRAFYSPFQSDDYYRYKPLYQITTQGDDDPEEGGIQNFPADTYEGDSDFTGYDDPVGLPFIHTIGADGTHRYYDLQGRPLKSRPTHGAYIDNGQKVIR